VKPISERSARILVIALVAGLLLGVGIGRWIGLAGAVEIHARMPEDGGWVPGDIQAVVGEPLRLRLISDDVMHGFAIGQSDEPALDVKPGQVTETTLLFDQPGKYTYYCTRWCGRNHWRMRGTIEVSGAGEAQPAEPPLYVTLGLDIDAVHDAAVIPAQRPSASRGTGLLGMIPADYRSLVYYQAHSPADAWQALRAETSLSELEDGQLWDGVAALWLAQTSAQTLEQASQLYSANCAACHGESGQGDGVFAHPAEAGETQSHAETMGLKQPPDFTDPAPMLGASPAVLHGKIVRGGMGTGMPYWGPIFTDEQIWALVSYLWTFQFDDGG
jgi:cytochrome c oxidase subunit 2